MDNKKLMQLAIKEAYNGITKNHGGPFGSVIFNPETNEVVASGHNMVLKNDNPILHGEIVAIEKACKKLKTYDLSGLVLFTTGEPCPMCLGACKWANIKKVYYGCTLEDNQAIGFRDKKFDNLFGGREHLKNYLICTERDACLSLFAYYKAKKDKEIY